MDLSSPPHQLLLLPGMALNASVFPPFGVPARWPTFSGGPSRPGTGMAPYLADVDRLTDTADWRSASRRVVVAHSFGGMLALAWLLAHGGTGQPPVHGLVLIGTTAGPMYDVAVVRVGPLRLPARPLMGLWNNRIVTAIAKATLGLGRTAPVDFQRYRRWPEIAIGVLGWRQTTVAGRMAYREAMQGFDVRADLPRITVPTIVLHGTRDTYFRADAAADLAARLPEADLRLVRGARHVLPLTHPGPVRQAVAELLGAGG